MYNLYNLKKSPLQLHFPIQVTEPDKEHVLAVVFFTPSEWKSNEAAKHLIVQAGPMGPRGEFNDGTFEF